MITLQKYATPSFLHQGGDSYVMSDYVHSPNVHPLAYCQGICPSIVRLSVQFTLTPSWNGTPSASRIVLKIGLVLATHVPRQSMRTTPICVCYKTLRSAAKHSGDSLTNQCNIVTPRFFKHRAVNHPTLVTFHFILLLRTSSFASVLSFI